MPVGNSDRGVGLGAGQIMVFADYSYQNFDWWHAQVPDAYITGTSDSENFDHSGLFKNKSINLGFTIGLSDYWNISISQLIAERCMEWEGPIWEEGENIPVGYNVGDSKTVHHRTECSSTDFINPTNNKTIAFGGKLGDTRINFKYLLYNQGKGPGIRAFIGGGIVIPSGNTITEFPWTKSMQELPDGTTVRTYTPHRHFYLSDGTHKIFTEVQFFKKRIKRPVFWGGSLSVEFPIEESDYGFKPSTRYELSMLALSGPLKNVKTNAPFKISSIGLNMTIGYAGHSEWNGISTPNSKAIMYIPGLSILFASKAGTFGINIQRGYEEYLQEKATDIEETNKVYAISLSYRKLLDKIIDRLYW